ncbi:MAG: ribonuclease J [Parcubacteria group bacterium]
MTGNKSKARVQLDAEPVEPKEGIKKNTSRRRHIRRSSSPSSHVKDTIRTARSESQTSPRRATRKGPRLRDNRRPPSGLKQLVRLKRKTKDTAEGYDDSLKYTPLGGLGEIGRNMAVLEYKDEILLIDAGFGFPENDQPGIDYNIPNINYLKGKEKKIQALLITHGHYDHIGALPYIMDKIGNPPIYSSRLTGAIVKKRHLEFPHLPELDITEVDHKDTIKVGQYFEIEFVHVNHNMPEDLAMYIKTPAGTIFHTSDFKFDPTPLNEAPTDIEYLKEVGKRGITLLLSDSTGAEKPGESISESEISKNLEEIYKTAKGRIIAATFASLINRVQQMITLSEKYGRKVIIDGYSMKSNIEIMKELGEIRMKKDTQITPDQIDNYPDNQIMVIGTGAQGEERAVMMRIASGEHRHVRLRAEDTVIFSSSVIPGNERTVQRLQDLLYRMDVNVFHYQMMDIHAGGHALQDDLRKMIQIMKPKFFMPIHGYYSMMVVHGRLAQEEGISKDNVLIPDNGNIIHITPNEWWYDKKSAEIENIMVDGLGVGDVGNVVIRDRQVLAEEGMFVIISLINGRTGAVQGSPDIISRGFVYLKDNKELLTEVRNKVKEIVKKTTTRPINTTDLKNSIREEIGLFLFKKTERRPMILPVVIEV